MAPLINEEVATAWRALVNDARDEDGWRSIAVSGLEGNRLQAARQFPENREAILIGFDTVTLPSAAMLPGGAGFRVERISPGLPGVWLALVRQEEGGSELFSRMAADVVATMAASVSLEHQRQVQIFIGRIRAWQQFMSKNLGALGAEAELGLCGELVCVDRLIAGGLDAYTALEGWRGPLDGLQDFEIGTGAIEVKSTLSHDGFPATIMSLEQLDDSIRQPLFLFGCRFALSAGGFTLSEKVQSMRQTLAPDPAAAALFENALLHVGFVDAQAEMYTKRLILSDTRFVHVGASFPRLVPANVPAAIRRARYDIDLDAVGTEASSIEDVLKLIGAV